jgi:hypothetical protein
VKLVLLLVALNVFPNHEVTSDWLFTKDLGKNNKEISSFEVSANWEEICYLAL